MIFLINIEKLKNASFKKKIAFVVGGKVRLEVKKDKLSNRSFTQNYSDKVYEIIKVTDKYIHLKDHDKRVPKSSVLNVINDQSDVTRSNLDEALKESKSKKAISRLGIEEHNKSPSTSGTKQISKRIPKPNEQSIYWY